MRKYHILFNDEGRNFYSTGQNFEADSLTDLIGRFRSQYPNATFIALYDLDALNSLLINRKFVEELNEDII